MPPETLPSTAWDLLKAVETGDRIRVRVIDFENARFPKDENPRWISGEVVAVKEDVSYQAGEVVRLVKIGDPWEDGCYVDVIDTAEGGFNQRRYHPRESSPETRSLKAWRPHPRPKDRRLLGRVDTAEVGESGKAPRTEGGD